jgi:predicted peptidase
MLYEVGQLVYLFMQEQMKIVPARIVEQVVRRKFNEDTQTSYMVELPNNNGNIVNMDDIDAEVYVNLDELRQFMVENAVSNIDKMLFKAKSIAERRFLSEPVQGNAGVVE